MKFKFWRRAEWVTHREASRECLMMMPFVLGLAVVPVGMREGSDADVRQFKYDTQRLRRRKRRKRRALVEKPQEAKRPVVAMAQEPPSESELADARSRFEYMRERCRLVALEWGNDGGVKPRR